MVRFGCRNSLVWSVVATLAIVPSVFAATELPASRAGQSEKFVDLSPARQAAVLGTIVGDGCIAKMARFEGLEANNAALWSVECFNGQKYNVEISADDDEDIPLVTDCNEW